MRENTVKEKKAIAFVQEHFKDEKAYVGFSGGKDSIVTADLVKRSGIDYKLFYSFTGIDPPELVRFIRANYPECEMRRPQQTFWRNLSVHTPPSNRLRWCCTSLKKEPGYDVHLFHRIMGIRLEESSARSRYKQVNVYENLGHTHYYPIFYFTESDVWDYINSRKLAYPKLYDEGFDRLGCVICPYHSEKTGKLHAKYRSRWPKFFLRFERGITELYYKRVSQGKTMHYKTPREFLDAWYLSNSARWYAVVQKGDK